MVFHAENDDELPTCLKVSDIQKYLGISRATAYALVKQPGFPSIRVNDKRIITPKDKFFTWMNNQSEEVLS